MNRYRKFLVSILGALAAIVSLGVLHGTAQVIGHRHRCHHRRLSPRRVRRQERRQDQPQSVTPRRVLPVRRSSTLLMTLLVLAGCASHPTPPPDAAGRHSARPSPSKPAPTSPVPSAAPSATPGGRCHYRQGAGSTDPLDVLPDPVCTPGVRNPAVTQATIGSTICKSGWTATIRPPLAVTQAIKARSLTDYGRPQSDAASTELDHLLSLELGGAPADPANLWVEPNYAVPHPTSFDHNPKDPLENRLKHAICSGQVTLAAAQAAFLTDWTTTVAVLHLH